MRDGGRVSDCLTRQKKIGLTLENLSSMYADNLNHHFFGPMWALSAYLGSCIGSQNAVCAAKNEYLQGNISLIPAAVRDVPFMMRSIVAEACISLGESYENEVDDSCKVVVTSSPWNHLNNKQIREASASQRISAFSMFKSGAARILFGASPYNTTKLSPLKSIIIYSRRDASNNRRLDNAEDIAKTLRDGLMNHNVEVKIISDLQILSLEEKFTLFASTDVFMAPHGAWMANTMFMPSHSLVLTIEKDGDSFEAWDKPFDTSFLTVKVMTANQALSSSPYSVMCSINRVGNDTHTADYVVSDLSKTISVIDEFLNSKK